MFNVFVIKKWSALILAGVLTTFLFAILSIFYNFTYGAIGFLVGLILSAVIGNLLLKNPFTSMLEGKGLLVIDLNSSGIIKPFLVRFAPPYIKGKLRGQQVEDIFNRETIAQLSTPIEAGGVVSWKNGKLTIELDSAEYNNSRFAFLHYPVILFNSIINSVITKEQLSNMEKDTFSEHIILYLNRKLDELTSLIRDFGRYIVELTKPKSLLKSSWFWIVLVIGLVALGVLFVPAIIEKFSAGASTAIETISGTPLITPVP